MTEQYLYLLFSFLKENINMLKLSYLIYSTARYELHNMLAIYIFNNGQNWNLDGVFVFLQEEVPPFLF